MDGSFIVLDKEHIAFDQAFDDAKRNTPSKVKADPRVVAEFNQLVDTLLDPAV